MSVIALASSDNLYRKLRQRPRVRAVADVDRDLLMHAEVGMSGRAPQVAGGGIK